MTNILGRCLTGALSTFRKCSLPIASVQVISFPDVGCIRHYAARKGTRARKTAVYRKNKLANIKKREKEEQKKQQMAILLNVQNLDIFPDDFHKMKAVDNVFSLEHCQSPIYTFAEAVNNFRESHHPTMYNLPKAILSVHFGLDMCTKKKTQFADNVSSVAIPKHPFEGAAVRQVLAFCKTNEQIEEALLAGAHTAVGVEGVKMLQEGTLNEHDYNFVVAHTDVVTKLTQIRGILNKLYPTAKRGMVGDDIGQLVTKFRCGISFSARQDPGNLAYGVIETAFGNLSLTTEQLEDNLRGLIDEILTRKPKSPTSSFIVKGVLFCPPSDEIFRFQLEPFIGKVWRTGEPDPNQKVESTESDVNEKQAVSV